MVNPARLAVSAFFGLKWMASLINIYSYKYFFRNEEFSVQIGDDDDDDEEEEEAEKD